MDKEDSSSYEPEIRKGPWTMEEDLILVSYIAKHGEGVWNTLARSAGLKRTGKSCRLRWLNYLRPDVRRGNITPEEQLLIMELHSRWGNSWSRIARQLPGRTDNEIKNFWRTKIQKKLKCGIQPLGYDNSAMSLEGSSSSQMIANMEDGVGTSPSASSTSTTAIDAAVFLPSPSDDGGGGGGGFWSVEDLWTMQLFNNEPVN